MKTFLKTSFNKIFFLFLIIGFLFEKKSSTTEKQPNIKNSPILEKKSEEWKLLPKQSWENSSFRPPPEIDPMGFDKRSKITFHTSKGFVPQFIVVSQKMPFLGQILGSRSMGKFLQLNDTIFINEEDSDHPLTIGEQYGITQEPQKLKFIESARIGYAYPLLGKVRIEAVRNGLYIGTLLNMKDTIPRGSLIIKYPSIIPPLTPIPGPQPLRAETLIDPSSCSSNLTQGKEVFIDRGTEDGIKPGMIFRAYEHKDPSNDKTLTSLNILINADIQIIQASEMISIGIILENYNLLKNHCTVILVTRFEDLKNKKGFTENGPNEPSVDEEALNLDRLNHHESLTLGEKKILKQLENWTPEPTVESPTSAEPSVPIQPAPLPTSIPNSIFLPDPKAMETPLSEKEDPPTSSKEDIPQPLPPTLEAPPE